MRGLRDAGQLDRRGSGKKLTKERQFWIKLSILYGRPLRQLQQEISSREFLELWQYDRLHALPDPWLQTGMICSLLANINRGKGVKSYSPGDFIPVVKPRQTVADMRSILRSSVAKSNAKHRRA